MAYMHNGLLGGFSGKIGYVVGYLMNGKQYVRSAPKKFTRPASPEQMIQRNKIFHDDKIPVTS